VLGTGVFSLVQAQVCRTFTLHGCLASGIFFVEALAGLVAKGGFGAAQPTGFLVQQRAEQLRFAPGSGSGPIGMGSRRMLGHNR